MRKTRGIPLGNDIWDWTILEASRRSQEGIKVSASKVVEVALERLREDVAKGEAISGLPGPD